MSIARFHRAMNSNDDDPLLTALRKLRAAGEPLKVRAAMMWNPWY